MWVYKFLCSSSANFLFLSCLVTFRWVLPCLYLFLLLCFFLGLLLALSLILSLSISLPFPLDFPLSQPIYLADPLWLARCPLGSFCSSQCACRHLAVCMAISKYGASLLRSTWFFHMYRSPRGWHAYWCWWTYIADHNSSRTPCY